MKYVAPVRRELGVRTIFNILGPLTNPAGAENRLMGVFHPDLVGIQARVLSQLGARHAMVVHGRDGLDEISLSGPTLVAELKNGWIRDASWTRPNSASPCVPPQILLPRQPKTQHACWPYSTTSPVRPVTSSA